MSDVMTDWFSRASGWIMLMLMREAEIASNSSVTRIHVPQPWIVRRALALLHCGEPETSWNVVQRSADPRPTWGLCVCVFRHVHT